MYRKGSKGWFKHYDFILLDMICLQIAFVAGYMIRHGFGNPYTKDLYMNVAVFLELADIAALLFFETLKNVLKRGHWQELVKTIQHVLIIGLLATFYLFTMHEGSSYSRASLYWMMLVYFVLTLAVRLCWKYHLRQRMSVGGNRSLLVITTSAMMDEVLENIKSNNFKMFRIAGVAVIDCDMQGQSVAGFPVVANLQNVADYVCREWVDETLVATAPTDPYPQELLGQLAETGVTTHYKLAKVLRNDGQRAIVEQIGDYTVMTYSIKYATAKQSFMKRMVDIVGGVVGCLLTAIICVFIAPIIFINSPGPIFFSQIRVGKNGKKFRMYKFRSMYLDAEERKKELMEQNRVKDGRMFKMAFDPRVIGNRILPNGKVKKGIGQFIRDTSLDEFPQFFNVLKGDMSLVGTRPPTVDEWEQYELHHRARLSIKPGITGMWQVSGRSDISDFEDVVKLDTRYINEWSPGLDIKILCKTVLVVLKKDGSM
ncbi:MAG: sugar transferase [Lachnospiraceae bacterium]|nr:sugar transferase [Lachnospiraceae bacterium]